MNRVGLLGFLLCMCVAIEAYAASEAVWQKQQIMGADFYYYMPEEPATLACRIYTPPNKIDQLDAEAFQMKDPKTAIEQTTRFRKNGEIVQKNFLLDILGHGTFNRTEVRGSDWFAEWCLQYAGTLPEPIKNILRRKYADLK